MIILAIDLGKFKSVACLLNTNDNQHSFRTVHSTDGELADLIGLTECDLVVIEACSLSGWVADVCEEVDREMLCASPLEEAWNWKNVKRKTDRDDALKLAKLAALGQITPVHVPSMETRQYRSLLVYRKSIVGEITRVKNRIRSTFTSLGLALPGADKCWSSLGIEGILKHRKHLSECEDGELWRGMVDMEIQQLKFLKAKLKTVELRLKRLSQSKPAVQKLEKIKGVGKVAAQTITAWIDDPKRFKNGRQVSSYAGLVPRRYQSGKMDRSGRISKRGPKWLRSVLIEAAWIVVRYNDWARKEYERIHRGQKTRKKQAIVAVARKLLVRCWAMLKNDQPWRPPAVAA